MSGWVGWMDSLKASLLNAPYGTNKKCLDQSTMCFLPICPYSLTLFWRVNIPLDAWGGQPGRWVWIFLPDLMSNVLMSDGSAIKDTQEVSSDNTHALDSRPQLLIMSPSHRISCVNKISRANMSPRVLHMSPSIIISLFLFAQFSIQAEGIEN